MERGADIEAKNRYENTALQDAIFTKNVEVIKLLLDAGADPNVKNKHRITPLQSAISSGKVEIIKLLLEKGVKIEASDLAIAKEGILELLKSAYKGGFSKRHRVKSKARKTMKGRRSNFQ